jgi:hypothetical protein
MSTLRESPYDSMKILRFCAAGSGLLNEFRWSDRRVIPSSGSGLKITVVAAAATVLIRVFHVAVV